MAVISTVSNFNMTSLYKHKNPLDFIFTVVLFAGMFLLLGWFLQNSRLSCWKSYPFCQFLFCFYFIKNDFGGPMRSFCHKQKHMLPKN